MPGSTPRIAIIGAGPAGTMLARLLDQASIPNTIFEGEPSPNYRSQGGSLDLHTSTGLLAIKKAGLWDKFLEKARYEGDFLQFSDKDLNIVFRKQGAPAPKADGERQYSTITDQRPEIDRAELRQLLTESVPKDSIRWGAHLQRVEADGTLVFAHGTESGFDLIVGADGAWSKVRGLLSDVKPAFSRVAGYEMSIPDAATTAPEVYAAVNRGNLFAHATGHKLTIQQMGDGSLGVHAFRQVDDETWPRGCGYDASELQAVKKALLEGEGPYADWHPTLKDAISKTRGHCNNRTLWQLPVGFRWEHQRQATLIGDAAHLMTPFAGEGVNIALEDAMKLADAIIAAVHKHPQGGPAQIDALDAAVIDYEKEMWPRTEKVARLTDSLTQTWMFTPGTPRSALPEVMRLMVKHHTSPMVYPFASAGLSAYVYMTKLVKGSDAVIEI